LAFSVPGGDVASALAAGCPVVVKAHPSHPATSERCAEAIRAGAADVGLAAECFGLVHGQQAGIDLVQHPAVTAVGFTGSLRGGRYLMDLCAARPNPVPFYGEFGSINPVVVTPQAAANRRDPIAEGYVASMTMGTGQFCTKPGVILIPSGAVGDALVSRIQQEIRRTSAGWLLNDGITATYRSQTDALRELPGVSVLGTGDSSTATGFAGTPLLLATTVSALGNGAGALLEECFGPVSVVVRYRTEDELLNLLDSMAGSLTATIHAEDGDELGARVLEKASTFAGRIVWNAFPTGVAVTWSTNHGGPYPSTSTSLHTSVGATAIRRFLRPLALQGIPDHLLPDELHDGNPLGIPRREDGQYVPASNNGRKASDTREDR
jgi:NADP-dependent aldehyde dehydrogenase